MNNLPDGVRNPDNLSTFFREIAPDQAEANMVRVDTVLKKVDDKGTKGVIITAENLVDLHKTALEMYKNGTDKAQIKGFTLLLDFLDNSYRDAFNKQGGVV